LTKKRTILAKSPGASSNSNDRITKHPPASKRAGTEVTAIRRRKSHQSQKGERRKDQLARKSRGKKGGVQNRGFGRAKNNPLKTCKGKERKLGKEKKSAGGVVASQDWKPKSKNKGERRTTKGGGGGRLQKDDGRGTCSQVCLMKSDKTLERWSSRGTTTFRQRVLVQSGVSNTENT